MKEWTTAKPRQQQLCSCLHLSIRYLQDYLRLGSAELQDIVADRSAYDTERILEKTDTVMIASYVHEEGQKLAHETLGTETDAELLDVVRNWLKTHRYGKRQFEAAVYERNRPVARIPLSK